MTTSVAAAARIGGRRSAIDVPGLGLVADVAAGDARPIGGGASVAVPAQFDDGGDGRPRSEEEECDEEYHGRNATFDVEQPRVAE